MSTTPSPTIGIDRPPNTDQVGTVVSKSGLSLVEYGGNGIVRKTVFTLTAMPMTISNASSIAQVGSQQIYDFPAGRIRILDCVASLTITTTSAIASTLNSGVTGTWGIGSATATTNTLSTTQMNILPGTGETAKSFTSSTVINVAPATVTGVLAAVSAAQLGAILDGTATPVDVYLNVGIVTDGDLDADATVAITGTIEMTWINGGDV